jgi:transcriptional regulator with XRE-family HTH domain
MRSIDYNKLKDLRGERTQEFVAEKLGITKGQLSHYERGVSEPSIGVLIKILEFYQVSFYEIIKDEIRLKIFPQKVEFNYITA